MKFDAERWLESDEKIAIHCNTQEQANKLFHHFNAMGLVWATGKPYEANSGYDPELCYTNKGTLDYVSSDSVWEFEELQFPELPEYFQKGNFIDRYPNTDFVMSEAMKIYAEDQYGFDLDYSSESDREWISDEFFELYPILTY